MSTIIGGKDRTYYRAMTTRALVEETKYAVGPEWRELATALAERLEDKHWVSCPECDYEFKA